VHIHLADQYRRRDSSIHRLDPRTKILIALLLILAVALTSAGAFVAFVMLYLFLLFGVLLAQIELTYIIKRSFIVIPFALAAMTLPFTVAGQTLFTLPFIGGITVSVEGTIRFVSILIRSWISVQAAILLVAVTPFPDLLWGMRALRVPVTLVTIVGFAYRYLFVLSDEAVRLMRARAARSAVVGPLPNGRRLLWHGKVAGRMVGSLMLRSIERSERVYQAMTARGYTGEVRSLTHPQMHRVDYFTLFGCAGLIVGIVLLSGSLT
jgi:cobalt/nickel transport system permease protein